MAPTPLRAFPTLLRRSVSSAGLLRPTRRVSRAWRTPRASAAFALRCSRCRALGRRSARRTACSSTCGRPRCGWTPRCPSWSGSTEDPCRRSAAVSPDTRPRRSWPPTLSWFTSASTTDSTLSASWLWRCWEKVLQETPQVSQPILNPIKTADGDSLKCQLYLFWEPRFSLTSVLK